MLLQMPINKEIHSSGFVMAACNAEWSYVRKPSITSTDGGMLLVLKKHTEEKYWKHCIGTIAALMPKNPFLLTWFCSKQIQNNSHHHLHFRQATFYSTCQWVSEYRQMFLMHRILFQISQLMLIINSTQPCPVIGQNVTVATLLNRKAQQKRLAEPKHWFHGKFSWHLDKRISIFKWA